MIETLSLPFQYGYMVNAMWVSALVGGVCAFLSVFLMLKGWSLIGDALRDPSLLVDTIFARAVGVGDKLRLLALRRFAQQLTVDECFNARFAGISTRAFLEVSTEPCVAPAPSTPPCLMVRDRHFDENGLASGAPGEWRPLPEGIEGYTPRAGEQHVVRVKRFEQAGAAGGAPTVHFVLDLIIETRTIQ